MFERAKALNALNREGHCDRHMLRLGIICCRAQLFVFGKLVPLFTVFLSSIEARQPRVAGDRRCPSVLGTPQDRIN
jgi:hypothetical protein